MTESSGGSTDRRSMWLGILGGIALVIAIVALIVAISAKGATSSDARLTAQVNRDASLAVAGVHNQLQHDVTSATAVLQQLHSASAAATRTRNGLLRDVNQNRSAVAINRANIKKLQASIATLSTAVHKLNGTVANLTTSEQSLAKQVAALEKAKPHA